MTDHDFHIETEASVSIPAAAATRVWLAGELDSTAAGKLRDVLIDVVDARAAARILVDLDKVTFIDAAAISAILDGYLVAHHAGVALRLTNARGIVHHVFTALGMLALFIPDRHSGESRE
ncbi:STAS domain-containing protein [Actinoplanes sp. NPDC051859]|uniref:STAS domain-containing protein n=1 Tax=Actinoplanes sp. NPDC051859 TaxID=3363909 RepID=UPI0037B27F09